MGKSKKFESADVEITPIVSIQTIGNYCGLWCPFLECKDTISREYFCRLFRARLCIVNGLLERTEDCLINTENVKNGK
jgi:hypothetical protein